VRPAHRFPASVLVDLGLLLLSALVFALSFPSFLSSAGWFPLGFFCLAPLFAVVRRAKWPAIPFYGLFFGCASYALFNYWLGSFSSVTLFVVPPIHAVYLLAVLPALKLVDTLSPRHGYLLQSALWVCYEYFLKTSGFLAYSYGNLGYSQYPFVALIQIADLAGVWAVSLLVVYPSALLGRAFAGGLEQLRRTWRTYAIPAAGYAAAFSAVIVYGLVSQVATDEDRQWKVALVQQNVDPWKDGYRAYRKSLDALKRQSVQALREGPEIVIWSETSFVPSISWHTRFRTDLQMYDIVKELRDFLASQPVPFVLGNNDGQLKRVAEGEEVRVDYNAALLIDGEQIVDTYRKLHLVPFTESFPYKKTFPRIYQWLQNADTHIWEQGDTYTVFEAGGVRFSTPICFEDTFGDLCRGFIARGADVLVNLTNDAWSFSVPGAMQHMTMAIFRAVENRRSVVRSTNAGMTNIIDPNGRILASLPPFVEGALVGDVPVHEGPSTLYTRRGDWLPWVLLAASAFGILLGALWRWRRWGRARLTAPGISGRMSAGGRTSPSRGEHEAQGKDSHRRR
jgi:apolipoprotein N-acyltransferase